MLGALLYYVKPRSLRRGTGRRGCSERWVKESTGCFSSYRNLTDHTGSGVRINCISPGQIDVGIDLKAFDMRGMSSQLPPANLQSAAVSVIDVALSCVSFLTLCSHKGNKLVLRERARRLKLPESLAFWLVASVVI